MTVIFQLGHCARRPPVFRQANTSRVLAYGAQRGLPESRHSVPSFEQTRLDVITEAAELTNAAARTDRSRIGHVFMRDHRL